MALACNPQLLIADEPTTALDVTIQAQIMQLMAKIKEETKTAIILITHDLGVVANLADEVSVMYAGKIVERGSVRDIFYNPDILIQSLFSAVFPLLIRKRKRNWYLSRARLRICMRRLRAAALPAGASTV